MKILVLAINYANEAEVVRYAAMLSRQTVADQIGLVVVNNRSSDSPTIDLESELAKIPLQIKLFDPQENLGYLNGELYGYREFMKTSPAAPDWSVIGNTDIVIEDARFFEKFLNQTYDSCVWCVAPSVVSPKSRTYQNPHYIKRISRRKINQVIWIHEHRYLALVYSYLSLAKAMVCHHGKQESQYIYSPHGCYFFVKNDFMAVLKDRHFKGFLYSEESYISEILRIFDKKCYYDSQIELIHTENSVTSLLGVAKRAKYIASSMRCIRDEFYTDQPGGNKG